MRRLQASIRQVYKGEGSGSFGACKGSCLAVYLTYALTYWLIAASLPHFTSRLPLKAHSSPYVSKMGKWVMHTYEYMYIPLFSTITQFNPELFVIHNLFTSLTSISTDVASKKATLPILLWGLLYLKRTLSKTPMHKQDPCTRRKPQFLKEKQQVMHITPPITLDAGRGWGICTNLLSWLSGTNWLIALWTIDRQPRACAANYFGF